MHYNDFSGNQPDVKEIHAKNRVFSSALQGHLTFALKNEGVDLAVLKRLFLEVKEGEIAEAVRQTPTGVYTRRIWFLYEWLLGRQLLLPAADQASYAAAGDHRR